MSILEGFKKRKRYQENGNGEKQLLSYWTSSETVVRKGDVILENSLQNMQEEIKGKAEYSHASTSDKIGLSTSTMYGHAKASNKTPLPPSQNASPGIDNGKYACEDHIHPVQTNISGNAATATKLFNSPKINGVTFDGYNNISIPSNAVQIVTDTYRRFITDEERVNWNGYNSLKAPTKHASSSSAYGLGSAALYGHIRLSDNYSKEASASSANDGVGASESALCKAYNILNTEKADVKDLEIKMASPLIDLSCGVTDVVQFYNKYMCTVYGQIKLSSSVAAGSNIGNFASLSVAKPKNYPLRSPGFYNEQEIIFTISTAGSINGKNVSTKAIPSGTIISFRFDYFLFA